MDLRQYDYQEVALNLLETALDLYNQENYISSLNLACAAEEILGGMVTQKNLKNMNQLGKDVWLQLAQIPGATVPTEKEIDKMINYKNRLKNAVKHFAELHEKYLVRYTIQKDARMFIYHAMHNYMILFEAYPPGEIFKKPPIPC